MAPPKPAGNPGVVVGLEPSEDRPAGAPRPAGRRPSKAEGKGDDYFVEKDGLSYAGTHLLIDLWGAKGLDDAEVVETALKRSVAACDATLLNLHLHRFSDQGGISGVAVIAESHIGIHTWPERGYAAIDIFMCGACDPYRAIPELRRSFAPRSIQISEQKRGLASPEWFLERLHTGYRQGFEVTRTLHRQKTEFQELVIFDTPTFGRVLVLDGVLQTTEADEYFYHEMLAHPPLLAHGAVGDVLIIGGGDGGTLREVLKHRNIRRVTIVEIDADVVENCRRYLPSISKGAFEDRRTELVFADGVAFVAETKDKFDLIIVDSTDPTGPGEALFEERFYADCKAGLKEKGILVTQNGVPFLQGAELATSYRRLKSLFADATFYLTAVPSYVGGFMALGWASTEAANRRVPLETLETRFAEAAIETRYYTPAVHLAAFALPRYIMDGME